jgi:hypothetical protein
MCHTLGTWPLVLQVRGSVTHNEKEKCEMGVVTEADERITSAKRHIAEAISELTEIVVSRCWGTSELSNTALYEAEDVFARLLELRKKLDNL